ncbi:GNAT family N-acetyltransferase [Loktanella sp. SALINAS62]|uniref:GNAT family N-acetyltransferase n=1 Tax=Loktanella sp. SALINAS62 TaxID=2706124 RepID=UPI001B8BEA04|nr:GNAT family N-acetyltransferase [Loktanella sp. SALINAS62]MBS1302774.1 GNAT family N-acetyltransferase [Loktanella sp. SALINAS62]
MADGLPRSIAPQDVDDIHAIASHWPSVRQMGAWPWPADRDFTRSRCKPFADKGFVWAIPLDDRIVGSMAVTRAELGYMLHPDAAGRGLATRYGQMAVDHAFDQYDWDALNATVWYDNPASYRVLTKLGFVHWQTVLMRGAVRYPCLTYCFRLTRARWHTLRGDAQ